MTSQSMNNSKEALIEEWGIEPETLDEYIEAVQLNPNQPEYSPEQINLLYKYHSLSSDEKDSQNLLDCYQQSLDEGQSVSEALDEVISLMNNDSSFAPFVEDENLPSSNAQSTSTQRVNEPVSLLALLGLAEQLTNKPMTITRGLEFLKVCGLSEQPQYNPDMANRFLDAVDRVTNQGESFAAIASDYGVSQGASGMEWMQTRTQVDAQKIQGLMQDEGTQTGVELTTVYRQMLLSKVKENFLNGEVNQAYTQGQQQLAAENDRWDEVREQLRKDREAMGLGGRSYVIDVTPTESLSSSPQAQLPQGEQEG